MIASQNVIHIDGRTLLLAGNKLERLNEWEAYILSHRPDPFEALTRLPPGTPEEVHLSVARDAFNVAMKPRFVSAEEGAAFDASPRGRVWALWASLQQHHADEFPDIDSAAALLARLTQETPPSTPAATPEPDPAAEEMGGAAPASAAEAFAASDV